MAEMFKELDPDTMARSPGLTYQDLLDQDTHEVPEVLRLQSQKTAGILKTDISADYHDKELKNYG